MKTLVSLFALCFVMLSAWLPAQKFPDLPPIYGDAKTRIEKVAPVFHQSMLLDGSVLSWHDDGLVSLFALDDDGNLAVSFCTDSKSRAAVPQGPIGGDPVPVLTTSWCDEKGVTHTVTTPIVSSTAAGVEKAAKLHESLVAIMQAKHPPKPCPPPSGS